MFEILEHLPQVIYCTLNWNAYSSGLITEESVIIPTASLAWLADGVFFKEYIQWCGEFSYTTNLTHFELLIAKATTKICCRKTNPPTPYQISENKTTFWTCKQILLASDANFQHLHAMKTAILNGSFLVQILATNFYTVNAEISQFLYCKCGNFRKNFFSQIA